MKRSVVAQLLLVVLTLGLVTACQSKEPGRPSSHGGRPPKSAKHTRRVVELLPLRTEKRRIVDSKGRDVLLRGANVNSLGEYWQGVPSLPATLPIRESDWKLMESRGFSVVRLLVTWSRVQPTRGQVDRGYLNKVDQAVRAAKRHGIYTVIDMHQDAYSAFIATTDAASCPAGTQPARGWDGAPKWAVRTDGLSTCLANGDRNSSPAVTRAWNHFYDDTDGIRTEFVRSWRAIAERFAGRPEVAGYDLLNEPDTSRPAAKLQPRYEDLLRDTIGAIRAAEAKADFEHLIFVEPTIPAGHPEHGIVIPDSKAAGLDPRNVVAAAHNYAESIGGGSIEGMNGLFDSVGAALGVPQWTGEYGFWDTKPETLAKARRYAADEDRRAWGGAWWQWRQSCGDPHGVHWEGDRVVPNDGESTHLNRLGCPDNRDLGPNDAFLDILGRGYPRATPGRIDELRSDPISGRLVVRATAIEAGGEFVVWTPTSSDADHRVTTDGLDRVRQHRVRGGRIITARVSRSGPYRLDVAG